jgi:hypothetical protein
VRNTPCKYCICVRSQLFLGRVLYRCIGAGVLVYSEYRVLRHFFVNKFYGAWPALSLCTPYTLHVKFDPANLINWRYGPGACAIFRDKIFRNAGVHDVKPHLKTLGRSKSNGKSVRLTHGVSCSAAHCHQDQVGIHVLRSINTVHGLASAVRGHAAQELGLPQSIDSNDIARGSCSRMCTSVPNPCVTRI